MYLTVNARNRATSHAKACENATCVSSRPTRKPRVPLKYRDAIFVQRIETVFSANGIPFGSLGHVECSNCTLAARIRRVTNDPEPKIFTSLSIRQVAGSKENQVAIYLIIYFFFHEQMFEQVLFAQPATSRVLGHLRPSLL